MLIKVSDFVIKYLNEKGITDIFTLSGGGIIHLIDSLGKNKNVNYYCNYHEQACAISAEGYSRVSTIPGVCLVTTGPGGTNALTGVAGAWMESIPLLVISGQVRQDLIADYTKTRQIGPQEGDILAMAKPITKYITRVDNPNLIKFEIGKALAIATSNRPGPVWVEIPMDVQGSFVEENDLPSYISEDKPIFDISKLIQNVTQTLIDIKAAKRPLLICGNGIHISGSKELLDKFLSIFEIPVVLPYSAKDLVTEDHPYYMGIFGTNGQRRANFAIQNSDCIICIGVGLSVSKVGFNFKGFAPSAKKIIIDIDEGQLLHQVVKPDLPIQAKIDDFLKEMIRQLEENPIELPKRWLKACDFWKNKYPMFMNEYFQDDGFINGYLFIDKLSDNMESGDLLVTGNGFESVNYYQVFKIKPRQRTMLNANWGAMGWDLPAAIGVCIGKKKQRVVCVTGDGGIQLNLQELMTIRHYNLPIKIFIFNNMGYACIRASQKNLFEGRFVGADSQSGVSTPNFEKIAGAYNIEYLYLDDNMDIDERIKQTLNTPGPAICELSISPDHNIIPKASAFRREDGSLESRPLEDMFPFLPREEVWMNMHLFDDDMDEIK